MDNLIAVRGIGRWTASCYLLFVLGRPDVWPTGDRALYVAMRDVMELDAVPTAQEADEMADAWAPYRSVAARMLWHNYLGGRDWEPTPALPGVG
jgi:DNA-3-methyladenine glycosylase II